MYKELNPIPDIGDVVRIDEDAVELAIAYYFMTKKRERLFQPNVGNTLSQALFELAVSDIGAYMLEDIVYRELPSQVPAIAIVKSQFKITSDVDNNRYFVYMPYYIKGMEDSQPKLFKGFLIKENSNG